MRKRKPTTAELLEKALAEIAALRGEVAGLRQEVQTLRMMQPAITTPSVWPPSQLFCEPTWTPAPASVQPPLPRKYRTEPDWWPEVWCAIKASKLPSNFIH